MEHDVARGILRLDQDPPPAEGPGERRTLADRLLSHPNPPDATGTLTALKLSTFELLTAAEAGLPGRPPFGGDHGRALVSAVRGAHDRTDLQVRDLSVHIRRELGDNHFADAYEHGWNLDAATAAARVDPAPLTGVRAAF